MKLKTKSLGIFIYQGSFVILKEQLCYQFYLEFVTSFDPAVLCANCSE